MREVAALAGVSMGTISNVLQHTPNWCRRRPASEYTRPSPSSASSATTPPANSAPASHGCSPSSSSTRGTPSSSRRQAGRRGSARPRSRSVTGRRPSQYETKPSWVMASCTRWRGLRHQTEVQLQHVADRCRRDARECGDLGAVDAAIRISPFSRLRSTAHIVSRPVPNNPVLLNRFIRSSLRGAGIKTRLSGETMRNIR